MTLAACSYRRANCTLMARKINNGPRMIKAQSRIIVLAWAFVVERVTRIELALSAWEPVRSGPVVRPDLRGEVSVSDRETARHRVNGPLMARPPSSGRR